MVVASVLSDDLVELLAAVQTGLSLGWDKKEAVVANLVQVQQQQRLLPPRLLLEF